MANLAELLSKVDAATTTVVETPEGVVVETEQTTVAPIAEPTPAPGGVLVADLLAKVDRATDPDIDFMDALKGAVTNLPASAGRFVTDIKGAVTNPIQTIEALGNLTFGLIDKVLPDPTTSPSLDDPDAPGQDREQLEASRQEREELLDLTASHIKNRYGSYEKAKKTLANDPVGFMADLSTVLLPTGFAVKTAGKAGKLQRVARLGEVVQAAGTAVEPLQVAKQVGGAPFRLIPKALPEAVFKSAAKFSNATLKPETIQKITRLALDEKITPTIKGVDKLRDQINLLGNKIESLVDERTRTGVKIPIDELFTDFEKLRKDASVGGGRKALRQIANVKKDLVEMNRNNITPTKIQEIKQKAYKDLGNAYERARLETATVESRKAVARAGKLILEDLIPGIDKLNDAQGTRVRLAKELDKVTGRLQNLNFTPLTAAAASPASIPAAVAIGVIGRNKAKFAIIIEQLRKANPTWKPSEALTSLLLTSPERIEGE